MKTVRTFLASPHGRLLEHYAAIFGAAAVTTLLASSQHLAGVHGVHALAATLVGVVAAAAKAGYDAVRQLAIPALLAWFAHRGVNAPVSDPKPVSAAQTAQADGSAPKQPPAK